MSLSHTVIRIFRRIALFTLTKILQFVLPLPLFPSISRELAKFADIDPNSLTSVDLPIVSTIVEKITSKIMGKHEELEQLKGADASDAISLEEKISSWRQGTVAATLSLHRERLGPASGLTPQPKPIQRKPRIDKVDFETALEGEDRVINESVRYPEQVTCFQMMLTLSDSFPTRSSSGCYPAA